MTLPAPALQRRDLPKVRGPLRLPATYSDGISCRGCPPGIAAGSTGYAGWNAGFITLALASLAAEGSAVYAHVYA